MSDETQTQPEQGDGERLGHVSDAYADVAGGLGIERLRLSQLPDDADPKVRKHQEWRVERLERALDHLRAALVGTPRERLTPEQVRAFNEGHYQPPGY